jgi:hypothetical protein
MTYIKEIYKIYDFSNNMQNISIDLLSELNNFYIEVRSS